MRKEEKGITRESYNWIVRGLGGRRVRTYACGLWQNLIEVNQASRIRQNLFKVSELFYRVFYRDVLTVTRPLLLHLHMVVFLLSLLPMAIVSDSVNRDISTAKGSRKPVRLDCL